MRILVAATSSQGGAGIAARRSYSALTDSGIDACFLTLDSQDSINLFRSNLPKRLVGKFLRKSVTLLQRKFIQNSPELMTPISFNSLKWLYKIPEGIFQVVHLHAFYNLLSVSEIELICRKFPRVVITLHDERAFTGGCHYAGDCSGFKTQCSNCPLVSPRFKTIPEKALCASIKSLRYIENLEIISPSEWLANRAKMSKVLENREVTVCPNPIPNIFFEKNPIEKSDSDKLVLGFSSFSVDNPHKGYPLLVEALGLLNDNDRSRIELKIATQSTIIPAVEGIPLEVIGPNNDVELKSFYNEINILVVPSTEDNSPSVLGEALASGVRILGSNVGGIPELLDRFNQKTFVAADAVALSRAISQIINEISPEINRQEVTSVFSNKSYVEKVLQIYQG